MEMRNAIYAAILRLLRPLVRLLLRQGVPFGTFADLTKRVYIEVALDEFKLPGRKQTRSRVSILTGLSRKEVLRVSRLSLPDDQEVLERYNRASRVIGGWVRDSRFGDGTGNPAVLPLEGEEGPSFHELVKVHSGDVRPRAVMDELLRGGAGEKPAAFPR